MGNPEINIRPSTIKAVRNIIDELYNLTVMSPYNGGFTGTSSRYKAIVRVLVLRGCLVRTGDKMSPSYKWNEHAMAPTKVFYQSVAEEILKNEREIKARYYAKKRALKKEMPKDTAQTPVVDGASADATNPLSLYTDRELLDELLNRGWVIGNGELIRQERLS